MKVGETVFPKSGPFKGDPVKILTIEYGTGAKNGWFTCISQDGDRLLFAGEELEG
jgi:hypothetical protein